MKYRTNRDELALDPPEGEILYDLVIEKKPKVALEIGTHRGVSTTYIASALKEIGSGHLHTTDPVDYGQERDFDNELRDFVTFYYKMGKDMEINGIDFAFIDGFHTNDDVLPEIKNLLPLLNKGAVVVFHDAQDEPTNWEIGVNAAIKESGILKKCRYVDTRHGLQIYTH